jgi:glycerol-3-phosphate dehydrogenase
MTELDRATAEHLSAHSYDLVVVGGGINGVAIARDAATRGLSVALLERGDIAGGGTSSWNSRLIHGGLRYLEHGELALVYESLHDRECLLRIAPHLVHPLAFVVPLYRHNHLPAWKYRAGVLLFDILSARKSVPWHRPLSRKAVQLQLPGLEARALSGALHYYDGQVEFPERLVLEIALSAARAGADVAGYAEVTGLLRTDGRVTGVAVLDRLSHQRFEVHGRVVVNATGPWVDELGSAAGLDRQVGGTTGTHLVVDPFPGAPDACIYFEAHADNRAILVIPWNGRYLIGTTDDPFDGDPGTVRGTAQEVEYLISETNALVPEAHLTAAEVLFTYTGVRPLPYRPGAKPGDIPRSHLIVTHDDAPGLVTIVGGKLTPHLSLGRQTVDRVATLLGRTLPPSRTDRMPLPGATTARWDRAGEAARRLAAALPWEGALAARLVQVYGVRVEQVHALWRSDRALQQVHGTGRSAVVAAEVLHAVRTEGAQTLVDVLHRRTMVGLEPTLGLDVERPVAELMAAELGWDGARTEAELASHHAYLDRLLGGVSRTVGLELSPR